MRNSLCTLSSQPILSNQCTLSSLLILSSPDTPHNSPCTLSLLVTAHHPACPLLASLDTLLSKDIHLNPDIPNNSPGSALQATIDTSDY